jgi:hypothetical protein
VAQQERKRVAEELRLRLQEASGKTVDLVLTQNRRSMVSVRTTSAQSLSVRCHEAFLSAPASVRSALVHWIRGDDRKRAARVLRRFVHEHAPECTAPPQPRALALRPVGTHFDLREVHGRVNDRYFNGRSQASITWGRRVARHRHPPRSVRWGSYDPRRRLITVNRRLDRSDVPPVVLEYVVFHELVHEFVPNQKGAANRVIRHGQAFRRQMARFERTSEARHYLRSLLES